MTTNIIIRPSADITTTPEMAEPLSQSDYEAIKGSLTCWRDILLCKFLRATGLRISEVLGNTRAEKRLRPALTPSNLKEDGPYVYALVLRGKKKGNPEYERVYLPNQLAMEMREYIKGNRIGADQPIFKVKTRQCENIFHDAGVKAIHRRVKPHEFRALYIKTLLDGGIPVAAAAKMVGHEDSRTTEKHYYDLTREQRWEIQKRIPV